MTKSTQAVPPGFVPHDRSSPLTDPWEPLYANAADGVVRLGLWVRVEHCNGRHFLHGGLISALADNAMGLSVRESARLADPNSPGVSGGVTLNLNVDFVRRSDIGDWVEFRPTVRKLGRSISLTECLVLANDEHLVARATASFKTLADVSS